jgi:hypothetical protein
MSHSEECSGLNQSLHLIYWLLAQARKADAIPIPLSGADININDRYVDQFLKETVHGFHDTTGPNIALPVVPHEFQFYSQKSWKRSSKSYLDSQTLIVPIPTSDISHHFDWLIPVKVNLAFFKLHMYYYVLIYISLASLV